MIAVADIEDNERAIRRARVDLERALADVRSGLGKVEEAIELFRRLETDLTTGRRRGIDGEGE